MPQTYTLWLKFQPHRSKENLVYEAPGHNERETDRLSATTVFPYTDPKEGFAIMVSYEAKVSAWRALLNGPVLIKCTCSVDQGILGRCSGFGRRFRSGALFRTASAT